jgi:branched-chain amino acid transport system ATP-binding protein
VPKGAIVAVLGNNGAGKSTLLRAISSTLPLHGGQIQGGSISFDGRPIAAEPAVMVLRGITQVPEGRHVFADMTVEENLTAGGLVISRGKRPAIRAWILDLFPRLQERLDQPAGLLSGGEQQMLAIGRALMSRPKLLLLDEPSLGLAPQIVDRIAEIIQRINQEGTAIVLVEQNASMALRVADQAYVLEVGKVTLEGSAKELAASDEVRHRYLGVGSAEDAEFSVNEADVHVSGKATRRHPEELKAEHVTVRFGGLEALSDVSLTIKPGTTHAVIGPNGAGKSTLMNVLTGVYKATEGSVNYAGTELTGLRPPKIAALGISRTFQNIALSPNLSVRDNLLIGRHLHMKTGFLQASLRIGVKRDEEAQIERIDRIAGLIQLTGHLDDTVGLLSYGDRKRVELGRALCAEPDVLLLDEPVAGMNSDEKQLMALAIATLRAALGLSVVLVEHDMRFVMGLAEHVTVLDFGKCIADGAPEAVQADPEVIRAYLGSSTAEAA